MVTSFFRIKKWKRKIKIKTTGQTLVCTVNLTMSCSFSASAIVTRRESSCIRSTTFVSSCSEVVEYEGWETEMAEKAEKRRKGNTGKGKKKRSEARKRESYMWRVLMRGTTHARRWEEREQRKAWRKGGSRWAILAREEEKGGASQKENERERGRSGHKKNKAENSETKCLRETGTPCVLRYSRHQVDAVSVIQELEWERQVDREEEEIEKMEKERERKRYRGDWYWMVEQEEMVMAETLERQTRRREDIDKR